MKFTRITIRGMLALILLCGLGLAALRSHTHFSTQIVFTLTLSSLLICLIGAMVGRPRSFWIGAAVFGWGYAILVFGPWFSEQVEPWLLSSRFLDEVYSRFLLSPIDRQGGWTTLHASGNAQFPVNIDDYVQFTRTGHSLSTIVHAVAGGIIGLQMQGRTTTKVEETRS
jgi:hypothetical protein